MEPNRVSKPQLYVGNLPAGVRKAEVLELLERYGRLKKITMEKNYCLVSFESPLSEEDAVRCLTGGIFNGNKLIVNYGKQK